MSSFSTAKPKKMNPLDKVIKKNPRYANVETTLDTGSSMTKYLKKVEEIKSNYRYQQDEIFKRMKITTFVQLLLQVAEVDTVENDSRMDDLESMASGYSGRSYMSGNARNLDAMSDRGNRDLSPVPSMAASDQEYGRKSANRNSSLQGVIRGVGELEPVKEMFGNGREKKVQQNFALAEENLNKLKQDMSLPYLLLDMRDKDEYDTCHIISAVNYPIAMLSRSVNNETKEMLMFKNQPGKIIVVYDDDERLCPKAATTMVQRGYDNLFLLSGGMKLASKRFPEGLTTGILPASYASKPEPKSQRIANSAMSSVTSRTNYTSGTNTTKKNFDRDDVENLNHYLDEILMPASNRLALSSRGSTRASNFSATSNASVKTLTSIHERPFK